MHIMWGAVDTPEIAALNLGSEFLGGQVCLAARLGGQIDTEWGDFQAEWQSTLPPWTIAK